MDNNQGYWGRARGARVGRRSMLRGGALAGAGLGAWALAGCGDDDDKPKPTAAASAAASAAAAASASASAAASASPTQQVRRGGSITFYVAGQPPNLDVQKSNSAYANGYGIGVAYSGLVRPKAWGHKNNLIVESSLAEKWEQPDPATYVFKLRGNAKYHNIAPVNGRKVVAADIVYSVKRQIEQKVNAAYYQGMKDIVAVDESTVRITLDGPAVDFLAGLTDPRNKIVAKEAVDIKGNLEEGPTIGTGPWILKEWKKNVSTTVVRNPDYYIQGLPYLDEMNMPFSTDAAQWEAQFLNGQTPVVGYGGTRIPVSKYDGFDKNKYTVTKTPAIPGVWVMFNLETPQLKDVRIRKALSLAIDRELTLNSAYEGVGELDAFTMLLPGPDWSLPKEEIKKLLPYDPKQAKAMFDAAGGWSKQQMPTFEGNWTQAAGQVIQSNWKKDLGFETEIKVIDPIELNGNIFNPQNGKFTVACSAIGHAPTLTGDLETWLQTGAVKNSQRISDPELDRLIKAQKAEFDEKKRKDLVLQIQRLIIDKMYYIPLGGQPGYVGMTKKIHNFEFLPIINGEAQFLQEVWMDA